MSGTPGSAGPFWRVFPWDPTAPDGAPYSARYVPPPGSQTGGRSISVTFPSSTLPNTPSTRWRSCCSGSGASRSARDISAGTTAALPAPFTPLALVEAHLPAEVEGALPDLGDPAVLVRLGIRPDHLSSQDRRITQAISRNLHERGLPGFRWWSALSGDWNVAVLFLDVVKAHRISYGDPDPLSLHHPTVRAAARFLRMPLPGPAPER